MLRQYIPIQRLYCNVWGHPACRDSLDVNATATHTAPRSTHEYCLWDIHDKHLETYANIAEAIQNHTTFNAAPLIVVSRQDSISGLKLIATIPKNTMQLNSGAFWKGRRRSGHKTSNTIPLFIHMTPDCPKEDVHTVGLITRLRNTNTYKPDDLDAQHAVFSAPLPETPTSIHDGVRTGTDADKLALRAGFITRAQAQDLTRNGTPSRLTSTLAKSIERTCLQHTHNIWVNRCDTDDKPQLLEDKAHRGRKRQTSAAFPTDTDDDTHKPTHDWKRHRLMSLNRLVDWKNWSTTHSGKRKPLPPLFTPPSKKRTTKRVNAQPKRRRPLPQYIPPSKKRASRRTPDTATALPTRTDHFRNPTTAERREAQTLLRTHPDSALHSLAGNNHISSGAIDDAITMIIRPQLPAGTYALLSSDAMTIGDATNGRQRTRLSKVVTSNTITLIPLNDSQHWLLAVLNSVTCTITLHNSAGTYGQENWKPKLETWLRKYTNGPWRTIQANTLQQPGGTECGTHTLLNIMQHIPHLVRPDTSTIQWSSNLRTHLINTIAHVTHPATATDMGGPPTESDTTLADCTPAPVHDFTNTVAHDTDPAKVTDTGESPKESDTTLADCTPAPVHSRPSTNAISMTRETKNTPAPPPSLPLPTPHTPPNRGRERPTPSPDADDRARTRRHKVRDTATGTHNRTRPQAPTHHTVARDCAPGLHWEGDRNDQCEACNQGGTLTECTRCNIVWHASCLAPPLPFPLRPQDEIVCSEECWAELVQATLSAGGMEPQREDPNTIQKVSSPHTTAHQYSTHPVPVHLPQSTHSGIRPQHEGPRKPCERPATQAEQAATS